MNYHIKMWAVPKHLPNNITPKKKYHVYTINWNERNQYIYYEWKNLWRASILLYWVIGRILDIDIWKQVWYNPSTWTLSVENNEQRDLMVSLLNNTEQQ